MSAKRSAPHQAKQQANSETTPANTADRQPQPGPPRRGKRLTGVVVGGLLVAFASLAWLSVTSKSPTYDEPLHAVSAWLQVHENDFRVDSEDPPLWKYWAGLTSRRDFMRPSLELPPGTPIPQGRPFGKSVELNSKDPSTPALRYRLVAEDVSHEWPLVVELLYPCGRSLPARFEPVPGFRRVDRADARDDAGARRRAGHRHRDVGLAARRQRDCDRRDAALLLRSQLPRPRRAGEERRAADADRRRALLCGLARGGG